GVAAGVAVENFAVFAEFFDRIFEVRLVVGFVAGSFVFGQQESDLGSAAAAAPAAGSHCSDQEDGTEDDPDSARYRPTRHRAGLHCDLLFRASRFDRSTTPIAGISKHPR